MDTRRGAPLRIIPGLLQRQGLPNVIRGEETQVIGVIDSLPDIMDDLLVGLPGTHSNGCARATAASVEFDTFMTGEVYAALRGHTILGRTMSDARRADDEPRSSAACASPAIGAGRGRCAVHHFQHPRAGP